MKRHALSSSNSKRLFTSTASRKHKANFREARIMRGGYRL